jgi:hypothetical protein
MVNEDIPHPVLLNKWKHHAGAVRQRIAACASESDLDQLTGQLVVLGTDLMDLYTGQLPPAAIGHQVVDQLTAEGRLAIEFYRAWLADGGGYRTLILDDGSVWVLRLGAEDGRFVHIHPGRGSPHTRRVRANVLKTAVMVLAHVRVSGGSPDDVRLVNAVRRERLDLPPVPALAGDEGLGALLALLECCPSTS